MLRWSTHPGPVPRDMVSGIGASRKRGNSKPSPIAGASVVLESVPVPNFSASFNPTSRRPGAQTTLIIPCRNGAAVIGDQLEALAAQAGPPLREVLVIDNGSTDHTRQVVESYSNSLPNLSVLSESRIGRHHARNRGAAEANGEYLLFVDADDRIESGYVAAMTDALEHHELVIGRLDHQLLSSPGAVEVGNVQKEAPMLAYGFLPYGAAGTLGIHKSLFDSIAGFQRDICDDVDICWRAQLLGHELFFVEDAVVAYRQRDSLRKMFRQHFAFGMAGPALYRQFRSSGMRRRPVRVVLNDWFAVARAIFVPKDPSARARWVRRAGRCSGAAIGSLRYRTLYF